MKVKVFVVSVDQPKCGCGNWNTHWEKNNNLKIGFNSCFIEGCGKPAEVAGYVQVIEADADTNYYDLFISSGKNSRFLIPICNDHNLEKEYLVKRKIKLTSTGKDVLCGNN